MAKKTKGFLKNKKILVGVVAVIVIIIIVLLTQCDGPSLAFKEATAERQDLITYYNFSGNVESHDVQYVRAKSSESITRLYVKEGDRVNAGDLLYEIDSDYIQSSRTQAQTSLANANTEYSSAKANLDRMRELFDAGAVSRVEMENAENSFSRAQNQVTQANAALDQVASQYDDTRGYAEINGEVSKIYVKENETLVMGSSIMDIMDFDNLEVNVKVDEYDLSSISVGQEVDIALEALGLNLTGTINEIAREATVEMGVSYFLTTVGLPKDDALRVGLSAEVRVVSQSAENVITVPVAAVTFEEGIGYVQFYNDKKELERKTVVVGINDGKFIEISEGVEEGEIVLIPEGNPYYMGMMMQPPTEGN